jgi:hypothetical protein
MLPIAWISRLRRWRAAAERESAWALEGRLAVLRWLR